MTLILDDETDLAVRKHCMKALRDLGVRSLNEIEPHKMQWGDLQKASKRMMTASRDALDRITDKASAEERRQVELACDGVMELFNAIERECDVRTEEGSRSPRSQPASAAQLAKRPIMGASEAYSGIDGEHTRAFAGWLRAPMSRHAQSELDAFETRAASSLTGAAGGHVVPEIIAGPILSRARDANPMRGIVRVLNVATGDVKFPLSNADATSGWVGETDTRTATTEPTLDAKIPTFGVNYAYVKMTEELANDSVINITDWFEREVGMALGEAEMTAIISGNGTNKPKGMLNVAPEAGADGSRTADAFKFLPAAATSAFTADELLTMVYDLKARYRANGRWLMNSATAGMLRKLKTSDGAYLWQETATMGQPSTFSGYPVSIVEAMPDVGASELPIAFGDFEAAYILAQIQGMTVTAEDRSITEPGFNKLYVRHRIGGCVYDENAVRFLKMAAT